MKYAKIIVKNNYNDEGDLVFRALFRAYKKIGVDCLIDIDKAIIPGLVDEKSNKFYVLFTGDEIDYSYYEEMNVDEFKKIMHNLSPISQENIKKVMQKLLFAQEVDLPYEEDKIEMMIDDALDRQIEHMANMNGLSSINPYCSPIIHDFNDWSLLSQHQNGDKIIESNGIKLDYYKNFLYKCLESEKVLKKVV